VSKDLSVQLIDAHTQIRADTAFSNQVKKTLLPATQMIYGAHSSYAAIVDHRSPVDRICPKQKVGRPSSKKPLLGIIPWHRGVAKNGMGFLDTDWSVRRQEYDRREVLEKEGAKFNCPWGVDRGKFGGFCCAPIV
jgi:hypothetical protein